MAVRLKGTLETNNSSEFNDNTGYGYAVNATSAMIGAYGAEFTVNAGGHLGLAKSPNSYPHLTAGFYLDPNSCVIAAGSPIAVYWQRYSSGEQASVRLGYTLGVGYYIYARGLDDAAVWHTTSNYTISDGPHAIKFDYGYANSSVASNGYLRLYIDGFMVEEIIGLDLWHLYGPTKFWFGNVVGGTGGSGTFYLDQMFVDFASDQLLDFANHTGVVATFNHERGAPAFEWGGTGGNFFAVTVAAALNGNYGLAFNLEGTIGGSTLQSYVTSYIYHTAERLYFLYDPNGFTNETSLIELIYLEKIYGGHWRVYVTPTGGGGYFIGASIEDDNSIDHATANYNLTDALHKIETRVTKASSNVASDATLSLWLDGILLETVGGIDLYDQFGYELIYTGLGDGTLEDTATGTMYFDDITLRDDDTQIGNYPLTAVIGGPANATDCEDVTFDAGGSTDPDGTIEHYLWDFGDGTAGAGVHVTHRYEAGSYTVTLTVTDNDGLTDAATLAITVTACSAAELLSLLGEPSWYQSTELSITVSQSILNIYGRGDGFKRDYHREIGAYSHELHADGGYYSCEFSLTGTQNQLEEWLENGLGRDVTVYNPALETVWNGFVNEVGLELGPLSTTYGPLMEVCNIISGSYTPLDTTVNPPIAGLHEIIAAVIDAGSRDTWGPFIRQLSLGQCSTTEATQYVNSILAQDGWPKVSQRLSPTGGNQRVTLRCVGYVRTLEMEPYLTAGALTGTINASDKLLDVLTLATLGLWLPITNHLIATNTSQMTAAETNANARTGWEVIKGILSYGDAAFNRYNFSVGAGRRCTYAVIPSSIAYQRRLTDPAARILTPGEDTVEPWDVQPGKWMFFPDFMVGRAPQANMRRDPRRMFIETVNWRAPDPAPTLTGAKYTTVTYQMARQGLSGR